MAKLKTHVRRYVSIAAAIDILQRGRLPLLNPDRWDDRNDAYFMARYKEAKAINGLYALCAAGCSETYHHWRVFTTGSDGACLELRRDLMEAGLKNTPGVTCGWVDYLKLDQAAALTAADVDRLPFVKRHGFTDEHEFRIILESSEPQAPARPIALAPDWISAIYLNPWMPDTVADSVKQTLRAVAGRPRLAIRHSRLIDNTRWKTAGDRVLKRPSPSEGPAVRPGDQT